MEMEARNEAMKLIAKAKDRIQSYLDLNDIDNEWILMEAIFFINETIDKLAA